MLTNSLPHNQNMNLRTHDQSGDDQYLPEGSGRGCINMVRDAKVVTRAKDYGFVEGWKFAGNNNKGFSPVNIPN